MNHRSPRRRRQKERHDKTLEEIIVENLAKMSRGIAIQFPEIQSSKQDNPRQNTPRHILIKLTKIKHTHTNIKSRKGKATNNTQGDSHKDNSSSFNRDSSGQKGMAGHT